MADVTKMSFQAWLNFTFDNPIVDPPQFHLGTLVGDPEILINYCTRLFADPVRLTQSYTHQQCEQSWWLIPGVDGYLGALGVKSIPFQTKRSCIQSFYVLFDKLFSHDPMGSSCFMWWERLLEGDWEGNGEFVRDDLQVCSEIVNGLQNILKLESEECRKSALHGLAEFADYVDPKCVSEIIDNFLVDARDVSLELQEYAKRVLMGDVL